MACSVFFTGQSLDGTKSHWNKAQSQKLLAAKQQVNKVTDSQIHKDTNSQILNLKKSQIPDITNSQITFPKKTRIKKVTDSRDFFVTNFYVRIPCCYKILCDSFQSLADHS